MKLRNPLDFSHIKDMLKDQLLKTSGLQFDNWLFGTEKFTGLSRNRPQGRFALKRCHQAILAFLGSFELELVLRL